MEFVRCLLIVKELRNFEYTGYEVRTIEAWNLKLHMWWSLPRRTVGEADFKGIESRNNFVKFGVEGALRGREGALVLGQNGNGPFKPRERESGNGCYRPWRGVNGSTN